MNRARDAGDAPVRVIVRATISATVERTVEMTTTEYLNLVNMLPGAVHAAPWPAVEDEVRKLLPIEGADPKSVHVPFSEVSVRCDRTAWKNNP